MSIITRNMTVRGLTQVNGRLLDSFGGAAAAYSLRKLRTGYTGAAVRVRRSSDNTETDIGFVDGNLDEGALTSFVGYYNSLQYSEQIDNAYWTKTASTVTTNTVVAPDGTTTADKLVEDNTNDAHRFYTTFSYVLSTVYTASIYVKAAERNVLYIEMRIGSIGANYAYFNLSNGTVGSTLGVTNATMLDVGNGWYRCSLSATGSGNSNTYLLYHMCNNSNQITYTGTSGYGMYFWGAQINTGSIATNYQQTTSFTRDGMGYVTKWYDQSGNGRDAAQSTAANQPRLVNAGVIDKVNNRPSIYFDGSNDGFVLPTISSSVSNYSLFTLFENKSTSNALKYILDSQTGRILFALRGQVDGSTFNYLSFYDGAWKLSSSSIGLEKCLLTYILGNSGSIYKNGASVLSTTYTQKAISGTTALGGSYDLTGANINGNMSDFIIYPSDQSSNRPYIEQNIAKYYNLQPLLLDYYPSAAAAYSLRKLSLNYTGAPVRVRRSSDNTEQDIPFDAAGNIDEKALTDFVGGENLLGYSEELDNAYWQKSGRETISTNTSDTLDPIGTNTAEKITTSTSNVNGTWVGKATAITTSSGTFTLSVYYKKGNSDYATLLASDGTNDLNQWFNISNGTLGGLTTTGSGFTSITANISSAGSSWYRCSVTFTRSTTTQLQVFFFPECSSNLSLANTLNNYTYIWGAQLNTVSLKTYAKTTSSALLGNGFVTKWYDQSGNARDAAQTTAANQPRIVNGGVVEKDSGIPILSFNGSSQHLTNNTNFLSTSSSGSMFVVFKFNNATNTNRDIICGLSDNTDNRFDFMLLRQYSNTGGNLNGLDFYVEGDFESSNYSITNTNKYLASAIYSNGIRRQIYTQGLLRFTGSNYNLGILNDGTQFDIGTEIAKSFYLDGKIHEIVIYPSDQSTNRTAIESNISSYYGLKLLDTYSGAAAAYSLRKLNGNYTGSAIRVRRSTDNAESDIGFTSSGDLNELQLINFIGTASGYVTTWYDQSGNGRNATQTTATKQPRIVNAGVVDKVNLKPSVYFNSSSTSIKNFDTNINNAILPTTGSSSVEWIIVAKAISLGANSEGALLYLGNNNIYSPYYHNNIISNNSSGNWYFNSYDGSEHRASGGSIYTYSLIYGYRNGISNTLRLNGSLISSVATGNPSISSSATLSIGGIMISSSGYFYDGYMSEVILYASVQSSRTSIESNINTYYNIY